MRSHKVYLGMRKPSMDRRCGVEGCRGGMQGQECREPCSLPDLHDEGIFLNGPFASNIVIIRTWVASSHDLIEHPYCSDPHHCVRTTPNTFCIHYKEAGRPVPPIRVTGQPLDSNCAIPCIVASTNHSISPAATCGPAGCSKHQGAWPARQVGASLVLQTE